MTDNSFIVLEHNSETDVVTERPMTEEEIQIVKDKINAAKELEDLLLEQKMAKESADAKLTAFYKSIGLTDAEIEAKLN